MGDETKSIEFDGGRIEPGHRTNYPRSPASAVPNAV